MKIHGKILFVTFSLLWSALIPPAWAAVSVDLTVSRTSLHFPDSDPDAVPSVPASENPITLGVRVRGNKGGTWGLTVLSSGDLVSGSNTIGISHVTWSAQPSPFLDGQLDRTTPQVVASGSGNVSSYLYGTVRFYFKNSWNYYTGNYSQVIIYTLTAP
jgi:hypothetical protein